MLNYRESASLRGRPTGLCARLRGSEWQRRLDAGYVGNKWIDLSMKRSFQPEDVMDAALEAASLAGIPSISVAPNQGRLLAILAKAVRARAPCWRSGPTRYRALWLAHALPKDGKLLSLEANADHARVARQHRAWPAHERHPGARRPCAGVAPRACEADASDVRLLFSRRRQTEQPASFESPSRPTHSSHSTM